MPIVPDHDFRTGTIVRKKDDQGVIPLIHLLYLIENTADFNVHSMDHGGVDRHFCCLELLLILGQARPTQRAIDFAFTQSAEGVREVIGRSQIAFHTRQFRDCCIVQQAQSLQSLPAFDADGIPALLIGVLVNRNVVGQRMQGKVGSGERKVVEEGFVCMLCGMILQD